MNILQIFIFATAIVAPYPAHASSADGGDRPKIQGVCGKYSADKSSDQPQNASKASQRKSQNPRWQDLAKEARSATDLGIESHAAKLSLAAYCSALQGAITNSDRYELGAAALEDLLNARRYEDANIIYDELKDGLTTIDFAGTDRAQLHLQMARPDCFPLEITTQKLLVYANPFARSSSRHLALSLKNLSRIKFGSPT